MHIKYNSQPLLTSGVVLLLLWITPMIATSQWLKLQTPGIPRAADGKPNLTAPAPKTADGKPDLSGLWNNMRGENPPARGEDGTESVIQYMPKGTVLPFQPWAQALYNQRVESQGVGRPSGYCLPHTIPDAFV